MAPKIRVYRQGIEQQPVIVIDDFAPDPDALIAHAASLPFRPIGEYFPGVRAPTPAETAIELRRRVVALVQETFGLEDPLHRIEAYFSLIAPGPAPLHPLQRLPHFDGLGRGRIALLHHLGRQEKGGTAFYRHRSTGFETMDEGRIGAYNQAVNAELARTGMPPSRMIDGDTPLYQQIARYGARFNRLLIYRGCTLHSADVPEDVVLTTDPRTGRFSINAFLLLDPEPVAARL